MKTVWVASLRDLDARHLQYVYFLPSLLVTVIDVRLEPTGPSTTRVNAARDRRSPQKAMSTWQP